MQIREKSFKGFTLIEILIVVVIIAILASLIVPRMSSQVARAKAAEVFNVIGAMKRATERGFEMTRTLPSAPAGFFFIGLDANGVVAGSEDLATLGLRDLQAPKDFTVEYWSTFDSGWGLLDILAYYANGDIAAEYYRFTDEDTGHWNCGGPLFRNQVEGDDTTPCVTV